MSDDTKKIEDEIDALANEAFVNELMANPPNQTPSAEIVVSQPKQLASDAQIEEFVNDGVQITNEIVAQVMKTFAQDVGDDPEKLTAFSNIVKANNDTLKILNAQIIRDRDNKTKIEIAKIKEKGDIIKDVLSGKSEDKSIVSTRDEIFKELLKEAEDVEIIEDDEEYVET
jgi:hypothetical protein